MTGSASDPSAVAWWDRLDSFVTLVAVVDHRSLGAAARALGRTPSGIARSVAQLEAALSTTLFERHAAGVIPSAAGRVVAVRARRIAAEIEGAALLFAHGSGSRGRLNTALHVLAKGRKLRLILLLAERGTIGQAAEQLGLSPSAVSMALSRVEAVLDRPLFNRGRSGFEVLPAALPLLDHIKRIGAEMRHLRAELSSLSDELAGEVVVGVLSVARTYLFPVALAAFLRRYPGVQVRTVEAASHTMIAGLRSGDIDFTIGTVREENERHGLAIEPIMADTLDILARADNPLTRAGSLSLADLHAASWILPRPQSRGARLILAGFAQADLRPPRATVETADLQIIRQLLLSTDMLAIASPMQLLFELRAGLLRKLPVELGTSRRAIALLSRSGAHLSPAARSLMEEVRRAAAAVQNE